MGRKVLVIVNPVSGRRRALRRLPRFLDALRADGVEAEDFRTAGAGDAAAAAAGARDGGYDAVVAVGGDGTVNEVLNGLDGADLPVGVFPTGTANLLARDLAIPFGPEGAAAIVARGVPHGIDVGTAAAEGAGERRFLCTAGAGFDGAVVHAVDAARKGGLGFRGYFRPVGRVVTGYRFPDLRVTVDDRDEGTATVAILCNTRNYGGLFTLCPEADPGDGRLDLCLLEGRSRLSFFRYGWAAWRGTLPAHRDARTLTGSSIRVESDEPQPVQVDGDPFGTTPLDVTLRAGAARLLVAKGD